MAMNPKTDLGGHVSIGASTKPANQTPATVNGTSIDREAVDNPMSAVLEVACGAATGSPSAQTVTVSLQDSADDVTFADFGTQPAVLSADSTRASADFNLATAERYIRVERIVALTGGSSPAIPCAEVLILGGANVLPAT